MSFKRPGGDYKPGQQPDDLTRSQLLPILSKGRELFKRDYLPAAAFVCVVAVALFRYNGEVMEGVHTTYRGLPVIVPYYVVWLALLISVFSLYFAYKVVGKHKEWWLLAAVAALTALLTFSFALRGLQAVTCGGVGGVLGVQSDSGFLGRYVYHFLCAGLPEEILKSLPVLAGAWGVYKIGSRWWRERLGVFEPVDAMMIAAASAIGFAFAETVFLYVPKIMIDPHEAELRAILPVLAERFTDLGRRTLAIETAIARLGANDGVGLLIPRLVMNIFGHMAYSMYFAYFIGLAVLRPAHRWKLLAIGLVSAAAIHALWNSAGRYGSLVQFGIAFGAFMMMATAALKARTLSPNRAQLEPSQILDRFARHVAAPVAAPSAYSPEPAAAAPRSFTPAASSPAAFTPAVSPAPASPPVSETWGTASDVLVIRIGMERIPLTVGTRILERQVAGLRAKENDGAVAVVEENPKDPKIMGLKNLSTQPWRVTTDRGEIRELAAGRAIRIARGMRIDFAGTSADVV